jgi:hypothetical protein
MPRRKFYFDLIERALWTFAQSAAAVLIVSQDWTPDILKIAAVAGGLAVLKAVGATRIGGDSSSAATLPAAEQK